jgi:hypothetical protein
MLTGQRFLQRPGILDGIFERRIEDDEQIAGGVFGLVLLHFEEAMEDSCRIVPDLPDQQALRRIRREADQRSHRFSSRRSTGLSAMATATRSAKSWRRSTPRPSRRF